MKDVIKIIKERKFKYICFFWLIISIQFVIGNNLQTKGYSVNSFSGFLLDLFKIIFVGIVFIIIHYYIMRLFNSYKNKRNKIENKNNILEKNNNLSKNKWGIYFLIIILCWVPVLLAFFPVISNYDGAYQIIQVLRENINTRQPLIHTILLSTFYLFGFKYMNSCTLGVFLYSLFQMTIMALIFSYSVKYIEERTKKKWLRNISLAFYAIFPFNQLFPLMTTKDTLFAGIVLIFIIKLNQILEKKPSKLDYIFMILISVLMLTFRNNAVYAIIISVPFVILIMINNKKKLLNILVSCVIIILIYQICNNFLIYLLKAQKDSNQEKLSVFSQAIAKICNENEKELTDEEKDKISFYFSDYKRLGKVYESFVSDRTKEMINCENFDNNKIDFLNLMIHFGLKYPRQFIDSFLNTTRGYWYICDNSFNQFEHKNNPETKGCLELTFQYVGTDEFMLKENSMLPGVQRFYRKMFCSNDYTKIPILYVVFQPAIYFYIVLAYLLYAIYRNDNVKKVIGIFMFSYFVTCFLGPIALIRYIYAIIVCVPVMFSSIIKEKND